MHRFHCLKQSCETGGYEIFHFPHAHVDGGQQHQQRHRGGQTDCRGDQGKEDVDGPELVFEVISLSDRWRDVLEKVVEYLDAGVLAVCVLDPRRKSAYVNPAESTGNMLTGDDELTFPEILPGFFVRVSELFGGDEN